MLISIKVYEQVVDCSTIDTIRKGRSTNCITTSTCESNVRPQQNKRSNFCCGLSGVVRGRALYYRMRELSGRTSSYQITQDCRNIDRSEGTNERLTNEEKL